MPLVSVILPTYNRAGLVRQAVASVRAQTLDDWELLVLDDGSTDDTSRLAAEWCAADPRIRYVPLPHRGRSAARNAGIAVASGRYIAFLDSDDLFLPEKLARSIAALEGHPASGLLYTPAYCFNERGDFPCRYNRQNRSGRLYRQVAFFHRLPLTTPTIVVPRHVIDRVGGFDETLDRFEDIDMWRRIAKLYPLFCLPEPLTRIRSHSDNTIGCLDPQVIFSEVERYIAVVRRSDADQGWWFLRREAAALMRHYGLAVIRQRPWQRHGRRFVRRSLALWPFSPAAWLLLLRSLLHSLVDLLPGPRRRLLRERLAQKQRRGDEIAADAERLIRHIDRMRRPAVTDRYQAASLCQQMGRWEEAERRFAALAGDAVPGEIRAGAFLHLGELHRRAGRFVAAEECFRRTLALQPEHRKAAVYLRELRASAPSEVNPCPCP